MSVVPQVNRPVPLPVADVQFSQGLGHMGAKYLGCCGIHTAKVCLDGVHVQVAPQLQEASLLNMFGQVAHGTEAEEPFQMLVPGEVHIVPLFLHEKPASFCTPLTADAAAVLLPLLDAFGQFLPCAGPHAVV